MKVDLQKVLRILEVQRGRDDTQRGMQPEMILSCFYGLNREDTNLCEKCRNYRGCYSTLKSVAIER